MRDPERYGVVEFDETGRAISIEEKPKQPKSHYAVPGLYFYDSQVSDIAANLKPSPAARSRSRTSTGRILQQGQLMVEPMGRGVAWLDAGTHESLLQAAGFVQAVQERQGMMISCPEEIAYRMGYITCEDLMKCGQADEGQLLRPIPDPPGRDGVEVRDEVATNYTNFPN